jgi:molybdopterin-guanine dinucleotide biosynthesis protein A
MSHGGPTNQRHPADRGCRSPGHPDTQAGVAAITAVVLAGGRSSRFGSQKLVAQLAGRSLLEHVLSIVSDLADEVIVALPPAAADGVAEPAGVRVVRDPEAFGGPLVGLLPALDATTAPVAIVVAGDMPRLHPSVLRAMVDTIKADGGVQVVVLADDGGEQPLPLAVKVEPARAAAKAALDAGDRSVRALVRRLSARVLAEAEWRPLDPDGATLLDVDRPADLDSLARNATEPEG